MEIEYCVCVEQVIWRDNSKEENGEVNRRKSREKSRKWKQRTLKTTQRPKWRPRDLKKQRKCETILFFPCFQFKDTVLEVDSISFVAVGALLKIGALTMKASR